MVQITNLYRVFSHYPHLIKCGVYSRAAFFGNFTSICGVQSNKYGKWTSILNVHVRLNVIEKFKAGKSIILNIKRKKSRVHGVHGIVFHFLSWKMYYSFLPVTWTSNKPGMKTKASGNKANSAAIENISASSKCRCNCQETNWEQIIKLVNVSGKSAVFFYLLQIDIFTV